VLAVLAVLIALWGWGNSRYEAGYDKAMREAIEAAAAASAAYQREVDAAEARDVARRAATNDKFRPVEERAANAPHDPLCPDAGTRSLLDEAVRVANDTATARKGK
jgi:hypothetical protein